MTEHRWRALVALAAAAALRGGSLIDFEAPLPPGLTPNGTFFAGNPVDPSAELSNQFQNLGVLFTTAGGASFAALIDLGSGHATSGTNGIGAVNTAGDLDYSLDLDIFLVVPGTTLPAATDSISIRGDEMPIPGNVIFSAYDTSGNLVASGIAPDTAGGTYSLTAAGIHEFRLHSESGTVAYDDLSFDVPVAISPEGVPEPASFALLGLGFAGLASGRLLFRRFARQRAA